MIQVFVSESYVYSVNSGSLMIRKMVDISIFVLVSSYLVLYCILMIQSIATRLTGRKAK